MAITRRDIEGALNSYGYTGSFSDKFYKFLGDLGYKGSLSDRIMVWRKAGSPLTKPVINSSVINSQVVQIRNNANSSNLVSGVARVTGTGVLTGVSIPATSGIVANGATFAVTGGTVTVAVANNTVTMSFTPTP